MQTLKIIEPQTLISKSKQIANSQYCKHKFWSPGAMFRCKKTCLKYTSNKGKTKFGVNFFEETSRSFAIRARFYSPYPGIFYLKKQFSVPWFQRLFARRKKREARRKSLRSHRLQIPLPHLIGSEFECRMWLVICKICQTGLGNKHYCKLIIAIFI
jgi:hypothetical protein